MVPFQGSDAREFWQRAEERNATTADLYAQLGLTHYAAMEAFVRRELLIVGSRFEVRSSKFDVS